jgi:hypothetical protein
LLVDVAPPAFEKATALMRAINENGTEIDDVTLIR